MSSVAFWNARKKQKRNPQVHFQLKDPRTLIIRQKHIHGDNTFQNFTPAGRWQYAVPVECLQSVVDTCDSRGWEVVPFPDIVQEALDRAVNKPFDDAFKETHLWQCMFPYQREGVMDVVRRKNGRALIGDEMGLGKTLQAIAIYKYYNHTKLLVICPAYLRYNWRHEIEKWVPGTETTIISTGKDPLDGVLPLIISYELAASKSKELAKMKFDMVVCDESHYMKSHKTKRTKGITPLVKNIPHALLLTGTPCLNRPIELFPQMHMLYPKFFPKYKQFAERYCDGKMSPMGFYDDSGISNNFELTWYVRKIALIRRVKRDVLTDLPPKRRTELYLQLTKKEIKPMLPKFDKWKDLNARIPHMVPCSDEVKKAAFERKALIAELFRNTCEAKANVVKKVVKDMVEQGLKFIVFCYHKLLLDEVESVCNSFIRIDGDTPQKKRQDLVDRFQNGDAQVAVLSLLAASTGLTLTASSIVLFAELYFVPGTILQAEDRVHRIGQTSMCDIRFIIAKGGLDEHLWKMVHHKLQTLDCALDGRADRTIKGEEVEWHGLDE
jgi:SWI/SNF-related matrix-associated actin-dependent regulator of chromatin subfamily A-like protein 1